jgi:hypothetical protein
VFAIDYDVTVEDMPQMASTVCEPQAAKIADGLYKDLPPSAKVREQCATVAPPP